MKQSPAGLLAALLLGRASFSTARCADSSPSPNIVGLSCAADPLPTRAPAVEAMKAATDYSKSQTGQTMVVIFDGKVIFEQYDNGGAREQPHYLASGQKGFIGAGAVAAIQDGLIKLDNPAVENIPEWKNDPEKSTITYRQLLGMTSGLTHPTGDDGKKMTWKQKIAMPMAAKQPKLKHLRRIAIDEISVGNRDVRSGFCPEPPDFRGIARIKEKNRRVRFDTAGDQAVASGRLSATSCGRTTGAIYSSK